MILAVAHNKVSLDLPCAALSRLKMKLYGIMFVIPPLVCHVPQDPEVLNGNRPVKNM